MSNKRSLMEIVAERTAETLGDIGDIQDLKDENQDLKDEVRDLENLVARLRREVARANRRLDETEALAELWKRRAETQADRYWLNKELASDDAMCEVECVDEQSDAGDAM